MTHAKEPRTAEEWFQWAHRDKFDVYYNEPRVVEAIRRAQLQSEEDGYDRGYEEAIEECLEIAIDGSLIEDRIRALLNEKS